MARRYKWVENVTGNFICIAFYIGTKKILSRVDGRTEMMKWFALIFRTAIATQDLTFVGNLLPLSSFCERSKLYNESSY